MAEAGGYTHCAWDLSVICMYIATPASMRQGVQEPSLSSSLLENLLILGEVCGSLDVASQPDPAIAGYLMQAVAFASFECGILKCQGSNTNRLRHHNSPGSTDKGGKSHERAVFAGNPSTMANISV